MKTSALALGLAVAALANAAAAQESGVWARARNPELAKIDDTLARAESIMHHRSRIPLHMLSGGLEGFTDPFLQEARRLLDTVGGERSTSVRVRVRYANILNDLRDPAGCARVLETVVKRDSAAARAGIPGPPAPIAADAWSTLAICYAKLGKRTEEVKAYDAALQVEANGIQRAHLLANRAESMMAEGDLTEAVAGYRAAIAAVTAPYEVPGLASTYWGLAVALDRSANLEAAFQAIHVARAYDRVDSSISSPNWFYSPAWDESWYLALGRWEHARTAKLPAARAENFLAAVALWEEYISRAPATDRFVPLARQRLKQCERERDEALRKQPRAAKVPRAPGVLKSK